MAIMVDVMKRDFANPSSESHVAGWDARKRVEAARGMIAEAIGCDTDEIIFTSGATEADNIGVLGAALGAPEGRRRILIGATEHKAVLESALAAEQFGFSVELLPVDCNGVIETAEFSSRLEEDVAVVSVMMVNNEIGTIQPLENIVSLSIAAGAFVHTDATQAPTAMEIDMQGLGVDAASFSSHKIYGPKGIGALYLSATAPWQPKPLMFGGGQERGLRPGTLPVPLCVGFAEAFRLLAKEGEAERQRVSQLRDHFAELLRKSVKGFKFTARPPRRHPGNLHARFEGVDAIDLLTRLQPNVHASSGSACTSGQLSEPHVLKAIGLPPAKAREGVRFSIGRQTSQQDILSATRFIAEKVNDISARSPHTF